MRIHVIGDSHARVFEGVDPFVAVHIPMATAHNLISDTSRSNSKYILADYIATAVGRHDYVLLCFGEIDCRFHFYSKSCATGKPISELIDATIDRYAQAIEVVISKVSRSRVGVINIVPAGDWNRIPPDRALYGYPQPITPSEITVPIYREFHDKLAAMCRARGYSLIDIWGIIVGGDGHTKEMFVGSDPVHLNGNAIPLFKREIRLEMGIDL